MENGAKAGVGRGRRGGEAGVGSVEVAGKGAGQIIRPRNLVAHCRGAQVW
jgi:hypothetical protein